MNTFNLFNKSFLEKYIEETFSDRKRNSYPFLIDSSMIEVPANDVMQCKNIGFYCKQPQDWLSEFYDQDLSLEKTIILLQKEYRDQYLDNPNRSFTAIKAYDDIRHALKDTNFNLIFNNLIKFSRRNKPTEYDGNFFNHFKPMVKKEYELLNFEKVIFCIGPHSDYTDDLSNLYLNEADVIKLTPGRPYYDIYKDFRDRPVLHTYHPRYWVRLGIYDKMISIILDFIKK